MPPQAATVRVLNYQGLSRAFVRGPKVLNKEWKQGQRKIAEPTRSMAQYRALTEVRNMPRSPDWAVMRTGITQKVVYVALKEKSRRRRGMPQVQRKNLATLVMDRAMQPALEANAAQIFRDFDGFLAAVGRDWERD